jgi:hypothetical protein
MVRKKLIDDRGMSAQVCGQLVGVLGLSDLFGRLLSKQTSRIRQSNWVFLFDPKFPDSSCIMMNWGLKIFFFEEADLSLKRGRFSI